MTVLMSPEYLVMLLFLVGITGFYFGVVLSRLFSDK